MILKNFVLRLLKLQIIRLFVFCFMCIFLYYVFKTRSLGIVYGFGAVFLIIYAGMLVRSAASAVLFFFKEKRLSSEANEEIEKVFAKAKPLCGEYYVSENYLLVFKAGITDAELRLVPFSDIKEINHGKTQKGGGFVIDIVTEESTGKNRSLTFTLYSDDEKIKKEFNELLDIIYKKTKK